MNNTEKVTEVLKRAGCYMTLPAICKATGLHQTQAREALQELDDDERLDTVQVIGDQHGSRLRRAGAYMLIGAEA